MPYTPFSSRWKGWAVEPESRPGPSGLHPTRTLVPFRPYRTLVPFRTERLFSFPARTPGPNTPRTLVPLFARHLVRPILKMVFIICTRRNRPPNGQTDERSIPADERSFLPSERYLTGSLGLVYDVDTTEYTQRCFEPQPGAKTSRRQHHQHHQHHHLLLRRDGPCAFGRCRRESTKLWMTAA